MLRLATVVAVLVAVITGTDLSVPSAKAANFADGTFIQADFDCKDTVYFRQLNIFAAYGRNGSEAAYFRYWVYDYSTATYSAPSDWLWASGTYTVPWNSGRGAFSIWVQYARWYNGRWEYAGGWALVKGTFSYSEGYNFYNTHSSGICQTW